LLVNIRSSKNSDISNGEVILVDVVVDVLNGGNDVLFEVFSNGIQSSLLRVQGILGFRVDIFVTDALVVSGFKLFSKGWE